MEWLQRASNCKFDITNEDILTYRCLDILIRGPISFIFFKEKVIWLRFYIHEDVWSQRIALWRRDKQRLQSWLNHVGTVRKQIWIVNQRLSADSAISRQIYLVIKSQNNGVWNIVHPMTGTAVPLTRASPNQNIVDEMLESAVRILVIQLQIDGKKESMTSVVCRGSASIYEDLLGITMTGPQKDLGEVAVKASPVAERKLDIRGVKAYTSNSTKSMQALDEIIHLRIKQRRGLAGRILSMERNQACGDVRRHTRPPPFRNSFMKFNLFPALWTSAQIQNFGRCQYTFSYDVKRKAKGFAKSYNQSNISLRERIDVISGRGTAFSVPGSMRENYRVMEESTTR